MRYFILITSLLCLILAGPVFAEEQDDETPHGCPYADADAAESHECTESETESQECTEMVMPDGMIVHTEFWGVDMEATAEFYSSLFDWTFISEAENYMMFITPGDVYGGISNEGEPGMGGTIVYIYTSDIDAKLLEIEEAGGTIFMQKMEIPDEGWMAWFTDPNGNLVGLFSM